MDGLVRGAPTPLVGFVVLDMASLGYRPLPPHRHGLRRTLAAVLIGAIESPTRQTERTNAAISTFRGSGVGCSAPIWRRFFWSITDGADGYRPETRSRNGETLRQAAAMDLWSNRVFKRRCSPIRMR